VYGNSVASAVQDFMKKETRASNLVKLKVSHSSALPHNALVNRTPLPELHPERPCHGEARRCVAEGHY